MSSGDVILAVESFTNRPVALDPSYLRPDANGRTTALTPFFDAMRSLDVAVESAKAEQSKLDLSQRYAAAMGFPNSEQPVSKPFAFTNGYAIIPVHGLLINRFPYSFGFVTGYNFIRTQVAAASADPDVVGIIYDCNSPGGQVFGCEETAAVVRQASKAGGGKPSLVVVDATCCSAAYWLASSGDKIVLTPSGVVGSIGVRQMHVDVSGMMKQDGVAVTFIVSGTHKVDGNQFEPLPDSVREQLQAEGDAIYAKFVGAVASNRGLDPQMVRDTEAQVYYADEAKSLGLIDQIAAPTVSLEQFFNDEQPDDGDDTEEPDVSATSTSEHNTVTDDEHKAALATATASAKSEERTRIKAILAGPQAEGRTKLAHALAFDMDMSAEQAVVLLEASVQEQKPAATTASATTTAATTAGPNPLASVMDRDGGAGAVPDASTTGDAGVLQPVMTQRQRDIEAANGLLASVGAAPIPA